jgi:hypothetical protein
MLNFVYPEGRLAALALCTIEAAPAFDFAQARLFAVFEIWETRNPHIEIGRTITFKMPLLENRRLSDRRNARKLSLRYRPCLISKALTNNEN